MGKHAYSFLFRKNPEKEKALSRQNTACRTGLFLFTQVFGCISQNTADRLGILNLAVIDHLL